VKGPYISRVQIENFRNFKSVDVVLGHKQVLIGENNVGKTNFIRAIQLILDPSLSDNERRLSKNDFHDSIDKPTENGVEIFIAIEIRNYENVLQLVAGLRDAVISDIPPTLRFEYYYRPLRDENGVITGYGYEIYKGNSKTSLFTHQNRSLINLRVIKALRDVERELKGLKRSPVFQLVDQYNIPNNELELIATELKEASEAIMKLDEIIVVRDLITSKFHALSGAQFDSAIDLSTFDIDPERLLHTLQVLMGEKRRPISDISLGLGNIFYITLMLLLIRDRTVPEVIRPDMMLRLATHDSSGLLNVYYKVNQSGNFELVKDLPKDEAYWRLYSLLNRHFNPSQGFTILAVEEPEAHLHPVLQRLIYGEVLQKSETSVIFSSHSTHITSIAPIESIVHFRRGLNDGSTVKSSFGLTLDPIDKIDLERYLDTRRGEIYFGAGVILVEGIAEEYLIPRFAELLGLPLDHHQIVVCNVNSTHFVPYVKLLHNLGIPWCVITDGDYYELEGEKKEFHRMKTEGVTGLNLGYSVGAKTLKDIGVEWDGVGLKRAFLAAHGCFVGDYTLEVDIMIKGDENGNVVAKKVFSEIRTGGDVQQANFDNVIDSKDYWKALAKIEDTKGIGKGRFAQRLAAHCTKEQIPAYVETAIRYIVEKAKRKDE
jgi:putative ATP-dependent endonuclease of the OLD family